MFKQSENRINYLGSALFVLLIYLVLFVFAENQEKDKVTIPDYKNASEFYACTKATIEARQFGFLNSLLPVAGNFRFKPVNEKPELISCNQIILHKITFLEKTGLLIKPLIHLRFYNQYHPVDTDGPPHLS